jgi:hypothetical protein
MGVGGGRLWLARAHGSEERGGPIDGATWARGCGHRPSSGGSVRAAMVLCYRRQRRAHVGGAVSWAGIERKKMN